MNSSLGYFVGGVAGFVVAMIAAEYVSRQIWKRAPGN